MAKSTLTSKLAAANLRIAELEAQLQVQAPEDSMREELHKMLDEALDHNADAPSWKRRGIGLLCGIAVAAGSGYLGGYAAAAVAIGAALVTSSMFVFWLVYVLGILLTMYFGGKLSMWAYNKVVDKTVDRNWATFKSFFNPGMVTP